LSMSRQRPTSGASPAFVRRAASSSAGGSRSDFGHLVSGRERESRGIAWVRPCSLARPLARTIRSTGKQTTDASIRTLMKNHSPKLIYAFSARLLALSLCLGWGARGHHEIKAAAVRALPAGELDFLKAQEPWIVYLSTIPDTYRTQNEPFLKIFEDPNHGWFIEQSAELMKNPPRSRYEFVIALYQNHLRVKDKLTNARWTGTLPYAAVEHFERMQAAMRRLRAARKAAAVDKDGRQEGVDETRFIDPEIP